MPAIRAQLENPRVIDIQAINRIVETLPAKSIEESLDEHGAGVLDVARVIGTVLNFSPSDSTKLRAAQLAIEFRNLGANKNENRIVFNLLGNVTLNNLIVQE